MIERFLNLFRLNLTYVHYNKTTRQLGLKVDSYKWLAISENTCNFY